MKIDKSEIQLLAKNHASRRSRRAMIKIIESEPDEKTATEMIAVYKSLQPKQPNGRKYPNRQQRRAAIRLARLPGNKPGRLAYEEREQQRQRNKLRDERDNVDVKGMAEIMKEAPQQ